jgi:hypothetical protein
VRWQKEARKRIERNGPEISSAESSPVATGRTGAILSHQENIDVLLDEVTGISPK